MKTHLLFAFSFFSLCQTASAQLEIKEWKKICLEEQTNSVMYMNLQKDILAVNLPTGTGIMGVNTKTDEISWTLKFKKQYTVGFGIYKYGDNFMYSSNANTYDAKGKVSTASWIMTIDVKTGTKLDSVKLAFDAVTLSNATGSSGNLALIRLANDSKYSAVIVNKKSGEVKFELLKEDSKNPGNPVIIKTDNSEKYTAVGMANGKRAFYIFDFTTGKQLLNLTGTGDIQGIDFSSDSKYCFYIQNKKLNVVDLATMKLEKQISLPVAGVYVSVHSDNENLAISGLGTKVPVIFVNWKNEKITTSDLSTSGGESVFHSNGDLYIANSSGAVQCFVNKEKMPYLAKFSFKGGSENTGNIILEENSLGVAVTKIEQGSRVMILYAADKKYYSGTITELTTDGYKVIFDDGTASSVKKTDVTSISELTVGEKVQCRASDKKFYWGTIDEIKGEAVLIYFSDGKTKGWFPKRDIMQVK